MKLSRVKRSFLKLSHYFEDIRHSKRAGFLGLGQFVLLLALAPFIFDLSLYSIGNQQEVPSLYEYDANRFPALPAYAAAGDPPKAPTRPKPLSKSEEKLLQQCKVINTIPILFNKNQIQLSSVYVRVSVCSHHVSSSIIISFLTCKNIHVL